MRTTVTLDADVEAKLTEDMRTRHVSFKEALNQAVRNGLAGNRSKRKIKLKTYSMGDVLGVNLHKALSFSAELDDAESVHQLSLGK